MLALVGGKASASLQQSQNQSQSQRAAKVQPDVADETASAWHLIRVWIGPPWASLFWVCVRVVPWPWAWIWRAFFWVWIEI